jgi:GT2 family glycosyltransferase
MSDVKFSVVIPYKDRLPNMSLALEALSRQSLATDDFEVVVGAMENSVQFAELCRGFEERLNIVSVTSAKEWQVGMARNMAMRMASGRVIVLLDADMVLPTQFLERLWEEHYSSGANQCVVGQMIDYTNNDADVESPDALPFAFYEDRLAELQNAGAGDSDLRMQFDHVIPWAYAWTALIALPREAVERADLRFDLNFKGYGVEDLEWAYRVSDAGIPIVMSRSAFGIHLPHRRNLAANKHTESLNYRYFVKKWPSIEVELAARFGDFEANKTIGALRQELDLILEPGGSMVCMSVSEHGRRILYLGAQVAVDGTVAGPPQSVHGGYEETYPLIGLSLPFADASFDEAVVLAPVDRLSEGYREAVYSEARRVSRRNNTTEPGFAAHDSSLHPNQFDRQESNAS